MSRLQRAAGGALLGGYAPRRGALGRPPAAVAPRPLVCPNIMCFRNSTLQVLDKLAGEVPFIPPNWPPRGCYTPNLTNFMHLGAFSTQNELDLAP